MHIQFSIKKNINISFNEKSINNYLSTTHILTFNLNLLVIINIVFGKEYELYMLLDKNYLRLFNFYYLFY